MVAWVLCHISLPLPTNVLNGAAFGFICRLSDDDDFAWIYKKAYPAYNKLKTQSVLGIQPSKLFTKSSNRFYSVRTAPVSPAAARK